MTAMGGKVGIVGVGGLYYSQVGGGFHDVQGGPLWSVGGGCGTPFDQGNLLGRVDDVVVVREVEDVHFQ